MGPIHPMEHVLIYVLAFGPFVLLGVTIWVSRRRNQEDADATDL